MTRILEVISCGSGASVQDMGRFGHLTMGVTGSGAMDSLALAEGAALLRQPESLAAIELPIVGGQFVAKAAMTIALTGADMPLSVDGVAIAHATTALAKPGSQITVGAARAGVYGYLHVDGGIATPPHLGSRATHRASGLGCVLEPGQHLPLGPARHSAADQTLQPLPRFAGGALRIVESFQSRHFSPEQRDRLAKTPFLRDPAGDRMGIKLAFDGIGFEAVGGLNILSEIAIPGDIQMTGTGAPFVLMTDRQTTGGYPRIATVIPADLPRVAQAAPGTKLSFEWISLQQALELEAQDRKHRASLPAQVVARLRDPALIHDLLSYSLISGAITGTEEDDTCQPLI